jgi:hypothetical protein
MDRRRYAFRENQPNPYDQEVGNKTPTTSLSTQCYRSILVQVFAEIIGPDGQLMAVLYTMVTRNGIRVRSLSARTGRSRRATLTDAR